MLVADCSLPASAKLGAAAAQDRASTAITDRKRRIPASSINSCLGSAYGKINGMTRGEERPFAGQFAWAVRVRRCAVQRPEHPSDDTDQEPEPELPDSLPEALPWTPLFCSARLTDPPGPT